MIKGIILDLDGTVYRGTEEVPGAAQFISIMREQGRNCLFVTNRANRTPERIASHLTKYGIAVKTDEVLTSSYATARYLAKGSVYLIGEEGLSQAFKHNGFTITDDAPDYVVVGFDRTFTYDKLVKACRLIDGGAGFIATNPDKGLRTEQGINPGTGAIVAAIAAGCGVEPVMIGKPQPLIFQMALERLDLSKDEVVAVGDNIETDIVAGIKVGVRTVLILSGISTVEDVEHSPVQPTWVVRDYDEMARIFDREGAA